MRVYKAFRHFFLLLVLITATFGRGNAQAPVIDTTVTREPAAEQQPPVSPDSSKKQPPKEITSSTSLLGSKVYYKATDSIRFNLVEQKVYLFGEGEVAYEDINLKAENIELDLKNSLVFARYGLDSAGNEIGKPVFSEGEQSFTAREMAYNFQTKKGRIIDVRTQEGDSYIHSETAVKDSSDVYYIRHGEYTTCNLEHPHYAIKAGKLKVIPDDKIVTGPAYLKVADIPTPLGLPFGFFPNKKGQASGIIMPQYGESANLGFFLKEGGYYFGINDTFDLALKGDIYSYGSWAIGATTNYKIRYKFNGTVDAKYARIYYDDPEFTEPSNDFKIRWIHTQDPKANPNSTFSANVDAGSSTFNRNIPGNSYQYLNSQLQSNIRYSRSIPLGPVATTLALNARHSQNTYTRQLTINAPELTWSVNRFYPTKLLFPQKKGLVRNREIDKLGVSSIFNAAARIDTYDSVLVNLDKHPVTLNDITRYGAKLIVPISTSMMLFKYLNITPTLSGTFTGYYQTIEKQIVQGSTGLDSVITITRPGFKAAPEMTFTTVATTKLFGTANIRLFKMQAIRHVLTPSLSFALRPNWSNKYYRTLSVNSGAPIRYSIFEQGIYSGPAAGQSGLVSWSINNNVEMKLRDLTDTAGVVTRKVALIEGFLITGGYNIALDSFNWQPMNLSGRTKIFKVVDLVANATLDPYIIDAAGTGQRLEVLELKENKRLGRLTNASITVGTRLQSRRRDDTPKYSDKASPQELEFINNNPDAFIDFSIPWTLGTNYTFIYSQDGVVGQMTQALGLQGDFSLTPKWKIGFTSNYDIEAEKFSYNSINIYRDLHCWEMSFNWIPFGPRQSYTLDIRVKAPVLQDLKLTRRRDWFDFR